MTRKWLVAGAVVAIVLAGAGIAIARRHHKTSPQTERAAEPQITEVIPELNGRVQPRTIVAIAAPVEGVIEAFYGDLGQPVIKDQLLGKVRSLKLEAAEQQARLDLDQAQARAASVGNDQLAAKLEVSRASADQSRLRADVDRLEKVYDRQKGLWAAGATPRLAFEKAEKDVKDARAELETQNTVAKVAASRVDQLVRDVEIANQAVTERTAALDRAKSELNTGELHSPADGILLARHGDIGQPVDPATKDLIQIAADLTSLQVTVTAPQSILGRIQPGQSASVHLGENEYAGTVREIQNADVVIDFTVPAPIDRLDTPAQVKIKF